MSANIRGDESVSGCPFYFYFGAVWIRPHGVIVFLFFCGAAAQRGPGPPHS